MIIKGFIVAVGQPREWSNNNGKKIQNIKVHNLTKLMM